MTQSQALELLKTGANIFLTGEPGSGKTHTINEYVKHLHEFGIEPAVTASTGIAATHIGGMTIHSWSGIGISESLTKQDLDRIADNDKVADRVLYTNILIIDEVSMLSGSTLTMVDQVCKKIRKNESPFGGMQVILVGDFFQLPPISRNATLQTLFAFSSPAWQEAGFVTCYLSEQHRQDDPQFLSLLEAIRRDSFSEDHYEQIQKRLTQKSAIPETIPQLYTHNTDVDSLNDSKLKTIPEEGVEYVMKRKGSSRLTDALVKGCLSPEKLVLKKGAAVMFTKNNPRAGFVNGTLGTVTDFDGEEKFPVVKTKDGSTIIVSPMDWDIKEHDQVKARITQIPLRLAWAITIHKSQGMSMDAAAMNLSSVFEYGQGYVALSRVRRMDGLHIFGINPKAFMVHPEILRQDESFRMLSQNAEEYLQVTPAAELKQMQDAFMKSIGGDRKNSISTEGEMPKDRTNTHEATLALWNKGMKAHEIADERRLKLATILDHIEKLALENRIPTHELIRLVTPEFNRVINDIFEAFQEHSAEKLSPVFSHFSGQFSYDDLRIARIIYKSQAKG